VKFAGRAKDLASSRTELKVLLNVVQHGSDQAHVKKDSRQIFSITSSQRVDNSDKVLTLLEDILISVDVKMEELNAIRGDGGAVDVQSALSAAAHNLDAGLPPKGSSGGPPPRPGSTPLASSAGGDSAHRHQSIALQRQKSRELDWEDEVKNHISTEQRIAEENTASTVQSSCVIM